MMMLPEISAEDLDPEANKGVEEVNVAALERLANAPAYTGAIPLAIFDAAMKEFNEDSDVANDFFDLVATFDTVPSARKILDTIYARLQETAPDSADTHNAQNAKAVLAAAHRRIVATSTLAPSGAPACSAQARVSAFSQAAAIPGVCAGLGPDFRRKLSG